jgi:hypothetical protein
MTAHDVLTNLGVKPNMIEMVLGEIDEMPIGYELKKKDIKTGKMVQVIEIFPNHKWTDGTIRPIYCGSWKSCDYNVTVYLNTRV